MSHGQGECGIGWYDYVSRRRRRTAESRGAARCAAVLATLLLSVAFCANSANAAHFTPEMRFAFRLANHFWGGPPRNCATLDREIVPRGVLGAALAQATIPKGPDAVCSINLERGLAPRFEFDHMCAVMVHEDGHLHGLEHSQNPRSIMFPVIRVIPDICERAGMWLIDHPRRRSRHAREP